MGKLNKKRCLDCHRLSYNKIFLCEHKEVIVLDPAKSKCKNFKKRRKNG